MLVVVSLRRAVLAATCAGCLAYLASCGGGGGRSPPWTYDTAWVNASNVWSAAITSFCFSAPLEPCGVEGRDAAEAAGADVWAWSALNGHALWPGIVRDMTDFAHARGRRFLGTLSNIWFWHPLTPRPARYDPAIRRDPFGNAVIDDAGWFTRDATNFTSLHPVWEARLVEEAKAYVDRGVDGLLIDEGAFVGWPMDFNEAILEGFEDYLRDTLSAQDLQTLATALGFADFDQFDYAQVWRDQLPPGTTELDIAVWDNRQALDIPLWEEYDRYRHIRAVAAMSRIIAAAKAHAAGLGRELPVGFNIGAAVWFGMPFVHLADYVDLEFVYGAPANPDHYQYFPEARGAATVKLVQGLGLRGNLFAAGGSTSTDLIARGPGNIENAFRLMIADGYAAGGRFYVEETFIGIETEFDRLAPYYRFVAARPELFPDPAAQTPRIGLVQLWEHYDFDPKRSLDGLGQLLADSGYQYDVVFGAEDVNRALPAPAYTLEADALARHEVLIVPRLAMCWNCGEAGPGLALTESHATKLLDYVTGGGLLVVFAEPSEVTSGLIADTGPRANELLGYLGGAETALGAGTIVHVPQLWGPLYQASADAAQAAAVRAPLADLLADKGVDPAVRFTGSPRAVSAFLYRDAAHTVVHLVNYDLDIDADAFTPVDDLDVAIDLANLPGAATYRVTLHRPEAPTGLELASDIVNGRLHVVVPAIEPWSVLRIDAAN